MEFSQWLQQEMDKRQLTNYRLAKLSRVHQTTIANLLDGKKPQIETERKIREAISRMDYEKEKSPSKIGEGKHHIPDEETLKLLELLENREDIRYLAAASERATPEHVKATAKMFDELYGRNQDK